MDDIRDIERLQFLIQFRTDHDREHDDRYVYAMHLAQLAQEMQTGVLVEAIGRVSKRSCRGDPERLDVAFGGLISREETFQTQLLEGKVVWGA